MNAASSRCDGHGTRTASARSRDCWFVEGLVDDHCGSGAALGQRVSEESQVVQAYLKGVLQFHLRSNQCTILGPKYLTNEYINGNVRVIDTAKQQEWAREDVLFWISIEVQSRPSNPYGWILSAFTIKGIPLGLLCLQAILQTIAMHCQRIAKQQQTTINSFVTKSTRTRSFRPVSSSVKDTPSSRSKSHDHKLGYPYDMAAVEEKNLISLSQINSREVKANLVHNPWPLVVFRVFPVCLLVLTPGPVCEP